MLYQLMLSLVLWVSLPLPQMRASHLPSPHRSAAGRVFIRGLHMWETGDLSKFDEIVACGYVGHVASGYRNREGLNARIEVFRAKYRDVVFTIEDQISSGEKVVTRLTAEGTERATGGRVKLMGININRVKEGKLVEEWASWESVAP